MTGASKRFVPVPTPETATYWEKAAQGELWLPRCGSCGTVVFYPRPACPHCHGEDITWFRASGRGTVESFVVNHVPAPGYEAPYVIALIMLEEGIRLTSNLLGVDPVPGAISIGMPVEVEFEQRDGVALPQFRVGSAGQAREATPS
ncbi:MAG TPA: Zn-ribbon domain-containing OB-fold protein [Trebonia sp.]|jgi:hypothetical protein|nr:Zn-ribbon domain-containing OB-fold protein [Trebonia sp.]